MVITRIRHIRTLAISIAASFTMVFVIYNVATQHGGGHNKLEWPPARDYVHFEGGVIMGSNTRTDAVSRKEESNNINVYKHNKNIVEIDKHECVKLRTLRGPVPICIHPPERDRMISSYVKDYGTWEEDLLNATGGAFLRHPGMQFFDIGCNIGVYTLFVAKLRRKVVAIDPLKDNLKLLSHSLYRANLSEHVTLLWNAVSDVHENVHLTVPDDNIGGAYVSDIKEKRTNGQNITALDLNDRHFVKTNPIVQTITIDDLISAFKDSELFIKIDIEGQEVRAIKGARDFLQHVNVRYILMEWVHHRYREQGQIIIDILINGGFLPYSDIVEGKFLDPEMYYTWPENIFWIKR